jgi:hypothetical protein
LESVATTVLLQAQRGGLCLWQVRIFLAIGGASILVPAQVWKAGVRKYSEASS